MTITTPSVRGLVILLTGLLALTGLVACGDDRLSAEEFRERLGEIDARTSAAFDPIESAKGTSQLRTALEEAASAERAAAEDLDGLDPPEDAEDSVDRLVEALDDLADLLEASAEGSPKPEDLERVFGSEAIEQVTTEVEALRGQGYLPPENG